MRDAGVATDRPDKIGSVTGPQPPGGKSRSWAEVWLAYSRSGVPPLRHGSRSAEQVRLRARITAAQRSRRMPRASRFDGPEPSCLFPDDKEIGRVLMGPERGKSWPGIAQVLERSGLPRVDPQFGGRYWPAVKGFLDRLHNVDRFDPQGPMVREIRSNRRPDIIDPELAKLRPEKRFSRMIDAGLERRRKQAEARAKKDPE